MDTSDADTPATRIICSACTAPVTDADAACPYCGVAFASAAEVAGMELRRVGRRFVIPASILLGLGFMAAIGGGSGPPADAVTRIICESAISARLGSFGEPEVTGDTVAPLDDMMRYRALALVPNRYGGRERVEVACLVRWRPDGQPEIVNFSPR